MKEVLKKDNWIWFAWLVAFVALSGSIYASEVMGWRPCLLCWYQRVLMYPLVITLAVAGINHDKNIAKYVYPISAIGIPVGIYHYLLQLGVVVPGGTCGVEATSCAIVEHMWFGFITLPLLSAVAFALITFAVWKYSSSHK